MSSGDSANLVLTGFMGTGKTAVGRKVARKLGRRFVDVDVEIEARAGKPIPRIFAEDGETAFRKLEAALCGELGAQRGLVIATGGGALVSFANREQMASSGTLVCLTCDVDEILRRVQKDGPERPLLAVSDPRAEVRRLLEARREAYRAIPWQVDTTRLSVEDVAAQVIEIAKAIVLPVRYPGGVLSLSKEGEYPIYVGRGLLARVGGALLAAGVPAGGRVAVVSNPVVAPLYGAQVEQALREAGFWPFACSVPDGEQHKTLDSIAMLYEQFLAGGLDRSGTVLSLGGGVTGDMAGFAAASFMRGARFVQVPTTLLAMVDASVGGKTGVDLPQGKNLVGAFKQPALVLIDPAVLVTLPVEEMRSGIAEAIKHGVIADPTLFAQLETGNLQSPISIPRALRVKIAIVEQDPFEQGRRAVLNLGHTVGHALEKLSGFELRHGEAVGIGMVAAAHIAAQLGQASPSLAERIAGTLVAWGLPTHCPPFDIAAIQDAMTHDKKRRGKTLRWVLPHAIGKVEITEDVPFPIVQSALRAIDARSQK